MQHPEYIYYAAMLLVIVPSIAVNIRSASVVALAWVTALLLFRVIGVPDATVPGWRFGIDILGLIFTWAFARNMGQILVAVSFSSMAFLDLVEAAGAMHPYYAYWIYYWLAMVQVLWVLIGNDWHPLLRLLYKHGILQDPHEDFDLDKHLMQWLNTFKGVFAW